MLSTNTKILFQMLSANDLMQGLYTQVRLVNCSVFVRCRAEIECQAYRKMAAQKGISVDDTDEEWTEQGKKK